MAKTEKQKWHDKCWKIWSEIIRRKSKGVCYTCGISKPWKELQAGHYKHGVLDFDARNIHAQCVRCNKWLSGNGSEYALKLVKEFGVDGLEKLHNDASMAWKGIKWELQDYKDLYEVLKEEKETLDVLGYD